MVGGRGRGSPNYVETLFSIPISFTPSISKDGGRNMIMQQHARAKRCLAASADLNLIGPGLCRQCFHQIWWSSGRMLKRVFWCAVPPLNLNLGHERMEEWMTTISAPALFFNDFLDCAVLVGRALTPLSPSPSRTPAVPQYRRLVNVLRPPSSAPRHYLVPHLGVTLQRAASLSHR